MLNPRVVMLVPKNPSNKNYSAKEAKRIWEWLHSNGSYNKDFITLMIMQMYPTGINLELLDNGYYQLKKDETGKFAVNVDKELRDLIESYDNALFTEILPSRYAQDEKLQEEYYEPIVVNFQGKKYEDAYCNSLFLALGGSATDFIIDAIKKFYPLILETDNRFYDKNKIERPRQRRARSTSIETVLSQPVEKTVSIKSSSEPVKKESDEVPVTISDAVNEVLDNVVNSVTQAEVVNTTGKTIRGKRTPI